MLFVGRYVAVCEPLRYHTIMTSTRMHVCCALAWLVAVVLIAVLFSFHFNVPLCGQTIQHVYCSNRGILNLACVATPNNNVYGLSMTWSLSTAVFVVIAFSYIKILAATVKQGRTDSSVRSKAFHTCSSHLVVYILYQIALMIVIVSLRFPAAKNMWKFCSIMVTIFPPAVNPIIYGLVSKELRTSILQNLFGWVKKKHIGFRTS
ncbi:hypothetical protein OJAV_G00135950 [Oryzias javanicus]|uniref:G-protein coupled receptors family 1 profile domain-containing protein n=1 Tax=Oryzias javanicus TaxID=123683 RepID=A0A3S2PX30_ORYJA|nr:hypothetical protein OJAV_G00135950 [Oryzias javanicus]